MANSCIRRVTDTLWKPQNARNYGVRGTMPFCSSAQHIPGQFHAFFNPSGRSVSNLFEQGKNRICIIEECAFLIIRVINTSHESLQ